MLARVPAWLVSGIGEIFEPTEPPNDVAIPIDLDQIDLILEAVIWVAPPCAANHLPVR